MNYYNSLIGLPVLELNKQSRIGIVKDVLFSKSEGKILGIIIEEKGVLFPPKYIPFEDIEYVKATWVGVRNGDCIKEIKGDSKAERCLQNPAECKVDMWVYSKDNESLGRVSDVVFDIEVGVIEGYVISDGISEDLISGRKILNMNKDIVFENEKMVILDSSSVKPITEYTERGEKL